MIGFADAVKLGFTRYVDFSGRSSRAEFWWWFLFGSILGLVGFIVDIGAGLIVSGIGVVGLIFALVLLIPNLAIGVRRLHDVNRSGWWLLGPILGWFLLVLPGLVFTILFVIWACTRSHDEENKYGPSPLEPS